MRIYVSSSYRDLSEYRAALLEVLGRLKHTAVAMENYVSEAQIPVEKCLTDVAGCDLYIGLFAWRYGQVQENSGRSITELEYRTALDRRIPVLIFLLHEEVPWLPAEPGPFHVPGATSTFASGINPAEEIVGLYIDANGVQRGFLLSQGSFTTIDFPGAIATFPDHINPAGEIVGGYADANDVIHGFLLSRKQDGHLLSRK
jgi:Domain of unknown function (DUF4062)